MQKNKNEVTVTAKTLEAAVKEAAKQLNVNEDLIAYRLVSQSGGGIFAFLGRKTTIAAWVADDKAVTSPEPTRRQNQGSRAAATSRPARQARAAARAVETDDDGDDNLGQGPALTPEETKALVEDLRVFCATIAGYIGDSSEKVTAVLDDGRLVIDIDDEVMAQQITKNAKLAESLEHILRKKPRHLKRELPFRIFVDAKSVRRAREDDLITLARDLSRKVAENRRPIVLPYKSSYDRKIIHMALDKDDRVYTKSIGTGPNRKLMICPIKKREDEGVPDQE